ncbi:MAG: aminopeptidase, partial [Bacteroidales bacterium]|nr:aminopeptidase [Bacteroidales bacterium]
MKLKKSIVLLALLALIPVSGSLPAQTFRASRTPLEVTLSSLTGVTEVLRLESTEFSEKYQVKVRQMVNHDEVRDGFFEQRIFVMHVGADRPTVMVTEGYGADYASNPRYRE